MQTGNGLSVGVKEGMVYHWGQTGKWFVTGCKGGNGLPLGANNATVKQGNSLSLDPSRMQRKERLIHGCKCLSSYVQPEINK